jgi:hypothetical protein
LGYTILIGEMAKRDVTIESVSRLLKIHRNSVANKLNGDSSFYIEEAFLVRDAFFPNWTIEGLFKREKEPIEFAEEEG